MGPRSLRLAVLAVLLLAAVPASAQRGSRAGFGSRHFGAFPHRTVVFPPRVAFGGHFGPRFRVFLGWGGVWPVAVPFGYVPLGYEYASPQPTVIVIQQPPATQVVAAPPSSPPVVLRYEAPDRPAEPPRGRPLTLLVLKDHSIYALTDYRVEDGRLHYFTSHGTENSVALDQIDLEFTRRLNEERNVRFDLSR